MPGEKEYLKKKFSFLENIDNANVISPNYNEEFKEKELNLLSKNLFEDLFNNLLYYYNSNGKIILQPMNKTIFIMLFLIY